jgi:hypothetical protein
VEQDLHEPQDSGVVDLDTGEVCGTDDDRESKTREQGEVDVGIQTAGLKLGEAIGDGEEGRADLRKVIETLLQVEVGEVVGADLVA